MLYGEMHYPPEGGLWLRLGIDANGNEQWSNRTGGAQAGGSGRSLATQRPSVDSCPGALKANIPLRVSLAMATNTDSQVILDSAGAELLTPPGQAIVRRGAEMVTVMTPLLASAALEQHLARVRFGSVELTGLEKRVLQAARELAQGGKKISTRAIREKVGSNYNVASTACRRLRQLGLIVGNEVAEEIVEETSPPPLDAQEALPTATGIATGDIGSDTAR